MKYLVDANLSPTVTAALLAAGFDAVHVQDVGLVSASDVDISVFALDTGAVVISADSDFATLLALSGGVAPSLVLLRSADHLAPVKQAAILIANLPPVEAELAEGSVVSIVRERIRVRRLPLR
jgi:predicted nuclease of predicted toxin-antitoxin system